MINESVVVRFLERFDFYFLSRSVRIVKSRDRKLEKCYLDKKVGAILRKFVLIKVIVVIEKFKSCLDLDLDKKSYQENKSATDTLKMSATIS